MSLQGLASLSFSPSLLLRLQSLNLLSALSASLHASFGANLAVGLGAQLQLVAALPTIGLPPLASAWLRLSAALSAFGGMSLDALLPSLHLLASLHIPGLGLGLPLSLLSPVLAALSFSPSLALSLGDPATMAGLQASLSAMAQLSLPLGFGAGLSSLLNLSLLMSLPARAHWPAFPPASICRPWPRCPHCPRHCCR